MTDNNSTNHSLHTPQVSNSAPNFIEVLELARAAADPHQFLQQNYHQYPDLVHSIEQVLNATAQRSRFFMSTVAQDLATSTITDFIPEQYIGKTFGNWRAIAVINSTDKSTILKAVPAQHHYSQEVAIKIISPAFQLLAGSENIAMQAHYLSKLSHPHLVEIKEANINQDGIPYVVMEYLPGPDIVSYVKQAQSSLTQRLTLFNQLCDCINHLHQHQVIHADLKPGNILLDQHQMIKVIDLDLSFTTDRHFHEDHDYRNIKGHTQGYASPEQQQNSDNISSQTDVFSLGKLLAEMLLTSGDLPSNSTSSTKATANADNKQQANDQIITFNTVNKKTFIRALKQQYGADRRYCELLAIVSKAVNPNPNHRYASVDQLSADIQCYLKQQQIVSAYPAPRYYRLMRQFQLHRRFYNLLLGSSLLIALIGFNFIEEKQHSNTILAQVVASQDPRQEQVISLFDQTAQDLYQGKKLFQSKLNYYQALMAMGDAYLGLGQADKAAKFFLKAKSLFPDPTSTEHIQALTQVAKSYYTDNRFSQAYQLLLPYQKQLFNQPLNSTALIELFLTFCQVTSLDARFQKSFAVTDKQTKTEYLHQAQQLLQQLDFSLYNSEKNKQSTQVKAYLIQAINLFTLAGGLRDHNSRNEYSITHWQEKAQPRLKQAQVLLHQALAIINKEPNNAANNTADTPHSPDYLVAKVYLWLGRIEAELGHMAPAEHYSNLGINKTINLFGLQHPNTLTAYTMRYGSFIYNNNRKAYEAIYQAYLIVTMPDYQTSVGHQSPQTVNSQNIYYIYEKFIRSLNNIGYLNKIPPILDEFLDLHNTLQSADTRNIDAIIQSICSITYYRHFDLTEKLMLYLKKHLDYEAQFSQKNPKWSYMPIVQLNTLLLSSPPPTQAITLIESAANFARQLNRSPSGELSSEGIGLLIVIIEFCPMVEACDVEYYVQLYQQNIKKYGYPTLYAMKFSIAWLQISTKLANALLRKVKLKKAKFYIDIADNFIKNSHIDNVPENSADRAVLLYLQAKYYYLSQHKALFEHYKKLALPKLAATFRENSDMSRELQALSFADKSG